MATDGVLNDVNMFNLTSRQWVWITGSSSINPSGTYPGGTPPVVGGEPPPRNMQLTWSDSRSSASLFYVYGGFIPSSGTMLSDFWRFNCQTRQWTYLGGTSNQETTIATTHTPSVSNNPGVRATSAVTLDPLGGAWFFGGFGRCTYDSLPHGFFCSCICLVASASVINDI